MHLLAGCKIRTLSKMVQPELAIYYTQKNVSDTPVTERVVAKEIVCWLKIELNQSKRRPGDRILIPIFSKPFTVRQPDMISNAGY